MLKEDLCNFTLSQLQDLFKKIGKEKFRSLQVFKWIYKNTVNDFFQMTDLNKKFRQYLSDNFIIGSLTKVKTFVSKDGTIKYLFKTFDGHFIESVFIPHEGRYTVCLSSQIGCQMNCKFCATAKIKFVRNLTLSEIVNQLIIIQRDMKPQGFFISNVVFMGMGEPLLNLDNVLKSAEIFTHQYSLNIAKYRITISTCGIADVIPTLADLKYNIAISLNSADDAVRSNLMPINKKYPLNVLKNSIRDFYKRAGKNFISFEYIMFKDTNTSLTDIDKLIKYVNSIGWLTKVNLIRYNKNSYSDFEVLNDEEVDVIFRKLNNAGVLTTVRNSKGADIKAACGQLSASHQETKTE